MRAAAASPFVAIVSMLATLLAFGIWRWQGDTTLQEYSDVLFYVSLGICALGGLMVKGASGTNSTVHRYEEMHGLAEELRRLDAENRQAGISLGLLIFLAGLIPGLNALLIAHYLC